MDADSGEMLWQLAYAAKGELDYGNSPRATPLIHDGLVYLFGAFGHLTCADVATGTILWQRNVAEDFGVPPLDWGLAGSPLLLDERLFVQPGGVRGSIVAIEPYTGEDLWATGTAPPGHSSLVVATHPRGKQLVGYDKHSLGGWDPETGARLWTVTPANSGDFNVPTPIVFDDRIFVATENNGSRLYALQADGTLNSKPIAANEDLYPDSHSPVRAHGRIFGVSSGLHCLDPNSGLRTIWSEEESEFYEYAALIASDDRLLCLTLDAQLILIDATASEYRELGRLKLATARRETYSHPALLGSRLYVRIGDELTCLDLEAAAP